MIVAASGTPVCLLTSNGADKAGRARVTSESRVVSFIVQGRWKKGVKRKRRDCQTLQAAVMEQRAFPSKETWRVSERRVGALGLERFGFAKESTQSRSWVKKKKGEWKERKRSEGRKLAVDGEKRRKADPARDMLINDRRCHRMLATRESTTLAASRRNSKPFC